jgi:rhodanese-related sulfurtransferase
VAEQYLEKGFENSMVLAGGYDAWKKADMPRN